MNKSILMLGLVCAGSAAASGYLWTEMRAQRERAQGLQTELTQLRSLQRTAFVIPSAPPATAMTPVTDPSTTAPAATAKIAVAAPITAMGPAATWSINAVPTGHRFDGFEQHRRMLRDPEYRKLMLAQQRMSMARMHPDLAVALDLSREQANELLDLLAEQQLRFTENQTPLRTLNGPPDEAALQEMRRTAEEQQRNNDMELARLLGDTKLAEWKEYQNSMGARMQVNQLRTILAGSDSALRQDQIKPLVSAVMQEQRRLMSDSGYNRIRPAQPMTQEDRTRMMEESVQHTSDSNQRLHDAASTILSPEQLEGLDDMLKQNLDMQRMSVRMMRANAEAAERGEISADPTMGIASSQFIPVAP